MTRNGACARWFRGVALAGFACCLLSDGLAQTASGREEISRLIQATASYESGQSMESLRRLEALARESSSDGQLRQALEAGLVRLLAPESTLEAKQFACQQLATIGSEDSLPALAALLEKDATAGLACQALSTHPSPKAGEALRQALPKLAGAARAQVISTLGDRQDPAAVEPLTRLANGPDADSATAAILALGKIANEPARAAIAALADRVGKGERPDLARPVFEASLTAAEKLAAAGQREAATAIYERFLDQAQPDNVRRGAFEALLQLDQDGGERRIIDTLRGTDALLKPVAIAGMRALRSPDASEKFAATLPTLSANEQVWLIEALADRRDEAARTAVEASVASPHAAVRLAAIQAVGKNADAKTVALLCGAFAANRGSLERTALERALMSLPRENEFEQALVEQFERAAAEVKPSLMRVLARRESRAAVPALLKASEQAEFAESAFQALASLAIAEDVPALLGRLSQLNATHARADAEYAVAQALLKMDAPARRAEVVLSVLEKTKDSETRRSLLRLLPACPDARALAVLTAAQRDREPQVRDTALRALVEWPDVRAWNTLAETVRQTTNELHRALAFTALTRLAEGENAMPNAPVRERYGVLLESARTDADRQLVLSALAGAAHPDALRLALSLLSNPGVGQEAALAVRKIAESIKKEHPQAAADALRQLE